MKESLGAKVLAFPTPVWIVGTYDKKGDPNLMTAAWGGVCCSRPPCIYVSLRKATYTHGNILQRRAFTVSIPGVEHAEEADYVGIVSGKDVNKFQDTGLTPIGSDIVDAPYVNEFPLIIECKLTQVVEIGSHTEFIGEIMDIKAEKGIISEDGYPEIEKVKPMIFSPGKRIYNVTGKYVGKAFSMGRDKFPK